MFRKSVAKGAAFLGGVLALGCGFSMSAMAQAQPGQFNWTGFYAGIHAGYQSTDAHTSYTGGRVLNQVVGAGLAPSRYDVGDNGFAGGGQLGYNYQIGGFVFGGEVDMTALDAGRSTSTSVVQTGLAGPFAAGNRWNSSAALSMDWTATARARLGLAADRWLFYVTGGAAWTDASISGSLTRSFPAAGPVLDSWSGSSNFNRLGYVLGGGVEYAYTKNWIVRFEGLYYDFGSKSDSLTQTLTAAPAVTGFPATRSTDVDMFVARVGLNYKF